MGFSPKASVVGLELSKGKQQEHYTTPSEAPGQLGLPFYCTTIYKQHHQIQTKFG
jgi:hypothetical protein